jgi:electron transfer flavoprotein alpha subunit
MDMASILVYSEQPATAFELVNKANELGKAMGLTVSAAVLGSGSPEDYAARGAASVYTVPNQAWEDADASVYAEALAQMAGKTGAELVMLGSTRRGKEIAGRLAQKLGAGCITDVTGMILENGRLLCTRNAFGGATVATQSVASGVQVVSVMPRTFEPAPAGEPAGQVVPLDLDLKPSRVKVVARVSKDQASADIEGAEVLVCVGKGLAGQEQLKMVEALASALGGLVACSKPIATDEKWLPEDRIVGLSGKKGKPALAVCLGISGQVQFTVGIREAKTIVAVNTDQNAYIFQMADYGVVGDLHEVVPRLTAALKG